MYKTIKKIYSAPAIAIECYETSSLMTITSMEVNREVVVENQSEILSRRRQTVWEDSDSEEDF
jgi:hypothetical protein